ncbi:MAG: hypothetical protein NZ108_07120, partial [Bacteroidia bacterium]|nr:hypothetical protein [Bacteroidia bacterium]
MTKYFFYGQKVEEMKRIFLFSILLLLFSKAKAQVIYDSLSFEKERTIVFPVVSRDFNKLELLKRTKPKTEQVYKFKFLEYKLPTISPSIKAYTLNPPPFQPLKANYVKLGIGNYWTSLLEAYLNSLRHEKINYGARLKHLSSLWGPVDKNNSASNSNEIVLNGKYMTQIGEMNAELGYHRRSVRFYGYDTTTFIKESDSIRQTFHDIHGNWG